MYFLLTSKVNEKLSYRKQIVRKKQEEPLR